MKLSFRTKLSYGIGGIADNAMFTMAITYLLFFLTSVAGIRPAAAGAIVAAGSIWEAVCGPIVGFLSDHLESPYGKRKPFLIAAALPAMIATSLLFTVIGASYPIKILFYLAMTLLFWQSFAMFFVPYLTWGGDLTEDYEERTVLRTYAYVFNQVGMAVGMVLPTALVDYLMNMGRSTEFSWMMTGIFVGVFAGGALLICGLTIHDTDNPAFKKGDSYNLGFHRKDLIAILKNYRRFLGIRPIRLIIGASLLFLIANTMFSSDRMYFFSYNLGLSNSMISLMMLLIAVVGISAAPAISAICEHFDKKHVYIAGIGGMGAMLTVFGIMHVDSILGCVGICIIYGLGDSCYWQLMPSLIYDVCEAEELISGEKNAAGVISLQALSESLSCAVGAQILGLILEVIGFQAGAPTQTLFVQGWINNCFTIVPGVCMMLVALLMTRHPIHKESYERILRALRAREEGEAIEWTQFEDIYGKRYLEKHRQNL